MKSRAALRRRKIKDYVAEGLRLALEADSTNDSMKIGNVPYGGAFLLIGPRLRGK